MKQEKDENEKECPHCRIVHGPDPLRVMPTVVELKSGGRVALTLRDVDAHTMSEDDVNFLERVNTLMKEYSAAARKRADAERCTLCGAIVFRGRPIEHNAGCPYLKVREVLERTHPAT